MILNILNNFKYNRILKKALHTTFTELGYTEKERKLIIKIYKELKKVNKQGYIYKIFPKK